MSPPSPPVWTLLRSFARATSSRRPRRIKELAAFQQRYLWSFQALRRNLGPSVSPSPTDALPTRDAQEHLNPPQLPSSISEAWKAGLRGQKPSQFSRLRSKAATPVTPPQDLLSNSGLAGRVKHTDTSDTEPPPQLPPKKSLLEAYLSLSKRSQKYISISAFLWALSGFTYFTWFAEIPAM